MSSNCGTVASGDFKSASQVYDKYCSPDMSLSFSTPSKNVVQAYITDLAQLNQYLPSCAADGLSYAVMSQTYARCPEAASLLAPCACGKEDVPDLVMSALTSTVKEACGNTEDVTAAANFYSQYCDMNDGTTSFTAPSGPPGDMTYHITALSQFSSLNSCARAGLQTAIFAQTDYKCAEGPQALASCVCIKSGMRRMVSSSLTSEVKYSCSSTATADVSSALAVFDYYCSAAQDDVVANVSESISEPYPTATSGSGAGGSEPSATDSSSSNGSDSTSGGSDDASGSNGGSGGSVNSTAAIVGGVLGGVIVLAIAGAIFWFMRRKSAKAKLAAAAAAGPQQPRYEYTGEPELEGSDHVSASGMTQVADNNTEYYKPHNELHGWTVQELAPQEGNRTELQGVTTASYRPSAHEMSA